MLEINQVYHGDCLKVMSEIDDKSIDMILCDLPYGTTACKWDIRIPFEPLWQHYKRIIKDNGAIVLTATEPFASYLRISNIKWYKYDWIWDNSGFQIAKYRPMMRHELVCVFGNGKINYYPIKIPQSGGFKKSSESSPIKHVDGEYRIYDDKYPQSIIEFYKRGDSKGCLHPTQKPVKLFEYLIKTYTNKSDLVLDNCAGSGTTGIAARNLNRDFILIEKELEYVKLIEKRLNEPYQKSFINKEILV